MEKEEWIVQNPADVDLDWACRDEDLVVIGDVKQLDTPAIERIQMNLLAICLHEDLTMICKKNSGKTANEWIREYTLAAITHELRNTELSVKGISNKTGFSNMSFFSRYVKQHLGCTPMEYRDRQPKE